MGSRQLQVLPWERYFVGCPLRRLGDNVASHTVRALHLICGTQGNANGREGASYLLRTRKPQPHAASSASSAACPLARGPRTVCGPGGRLAALVTGYVWRHPAGGGQHQELSPAGWLAWVGHSRSERPHPVAQVQELEPRVNTKTQQGGPPSPFLGLTQGFRQLLPHPLAGHNGNSKNGAFLPSFSNCRLDGQQWPRGIINLLEKEITGQGCKQTIQKKICLIQGMLQNCVPRSCCKDKAWQLPCHQPSSALSSFPWSPLQTFSTKDQ